MNTFFACAPRWFSHSHRHSSTAPVAEFTLRSTNIVLSLNLQDLTGWFVLGRTNDRYTTESCALLFAGSLALPSILCMFVRPNTKFSTSKTGKARSFAILCLLIPSLRREPNTFAHTTEISLAMLYGSSVLYFSAIWMQKCL